MKIADGSLLRHIVRKEPIRFVKSIDKILEALIKESTFAHDTWVAQLEAPMTRSPIAGNDCLY